MSGARLTAESPAFIRDHAKSEIASLRHFKMEPTADVFEKHIGNLERSNAELLAALKALTDLSEHVPVFQLDKGKSSVKAVRRAAKFMAATNAARAAIAKAQS